MSHEINLTLLRNRIQKFVERTWGPRIFSNRWERSMRILEEAIELAQVEGVNQGLVNELVGRVYSRPVGERAQEYAGIGVCWLAGTSSLCLDPDELLLWEVETIEGRDPDKFREKQRDKARAGFSLFPFDEKRDPNGKTGVGND